MIGVLQDPHFTYALSGVEIGHRPIDVEEHGLNHFLSFAWVAHDPERHIEKKTMISVEQNRKRSLAASCDMLHQLLVGEFGIVLALRSLFHRGCHCYGTERMTFNFRKRWLIF